VEGRIIRNVSHILLAVGAAGAAVICTLAIARNGQDIRAYPGGPSREQANNGSPEEPAHAGLKPSNQASSATTTGPTLELEQEFHRLAGVVRKLSDEISRVTSEIGAAPMDTPGVTPAISDANWAEMLRAAEIRLAVTDVARYRSDLLYRQSNTIERIKQTGDSPSLVSALQADVDAVQRGLRELDSVRGVADLARWRREFGSLLR
jgi:hypothetical protein